MSHVIPVKKNKENDFSMEFSASSKSREIDRSEVFPSILAAVSLGLSRSEQCFGFALANQMTGNHISSSGCGPDC